VKTSDKPQGKYRLFLQNFLSKVIVDIDRVLIFGDFNIHMDNKKDTLSLMDMLSHIGVRKKVKGPTHCHNHLLDFVLS